MYEIKDLFDKRSIVGAKLEHILKQEGYTKTAFCKAAEISRPTLDKILSGGLTNKTNYEKHIRKILRCLKLSPDSLVGGDACRETRVRQLRSMMRMSTEEVSKETEISLARLQEIEAGEKASLAELRDIALCLAVSVRTLQGEYFFEPQIAILQGILENRSGKAEDADCGFWGHLGILLKGRNDHLWFPITQSTRDLIIKTMENERMIIPCMNNKVLYLYMPNIKEMILNDFDCDTPSFVNWDSEVDAGNIPLVVYEALEDYLYSVGDSMEEELLSKGFVDYLERLTVHRRWSEDTMATMLNTSEIYYTDGMIRPLNIDFGLGVENLSGEIEYIYDFQNTEFADDIICVTEETGNIITFNVKNISMIQMPLVPLEDAIVKVRQQEQQRYQEELG